MAVDDRHVDNNHPDDNHHRREKGEAGLIGEVVTIALAVGAASAVAVGVGTLLAIYF